ncbi:MAG: patatin-like phospholipase family protein [Hyphomicrobium sp.]
MRRRRATTADAPTVTVKPVLPALAHTSHGEPSIGLALGGGGARGLAHILMLEAFDELGIKPKIIAGTSIGAIIGAAYASGISGADLRTHTKEILSQRFGLVRELFAASTRPFQRIFGLFATSSALLDPDALLELVMPKGMKADFETLDIPLKIVASDFYEQEAHVFTSGPLRRAVAASMALPVIFQPVVVGNRALIDGGLTNPLPFDLLAGEADIIIAIDVSGAPVPDPRRNHPSALEALFASAFLFERSIVKEKLKSSQPDILVSSGTSQFQVLDFLKFDEILAAAEPAKERLKAQIERVMSVETLTAIDAPAIAPVQLMAPDVPDEKKQKRRGLLKRTRAKHSRT